MPLALALGCTSSGGYNGGPIPDGGWAYDFSLPARVQLTAVEPSLGPMVGGISVKLQGVGFEPSAQVRFGNNLATGLTFQSPTELTVTLPASGGAFGKVPVAVRLSDGVTALRPDLFSYLGEDVSFAAPIRLKVGSGAYVVTAADVNRDAVPDILVSSTGDSIVYGFISRGDGTFDAKPTPIGGNWLWGLAVADLTGDGIVDFAVANSGRGALTLTTGTGTGEFLNATDLPSGVKPYGVVAADLDGNAQPELAVVNNGDAKVVIFSKRSGSSFVRGQSYDTGTAPMWLESGDFNRDGKLDLVSADFGTNTLTVLLGQGDATFRAPMTLPSIERSSYVRAADAYGN